MNLRVVIEVEVSKTMAETMRRAGFNVEIDGSGTQIRVGNAPPIPKRKTNITYYNGDDDGNTKKP